MKAAIFLAKDGSVEVAEIPAPVVTPGYVLVRNLYSLISAGTERARIETGHQSLIGKARSRPDQVKQVVEMAKQSGLKETYRVVQDRLNVPALMGYSSAGVVVEVGDGVPDLAPGDLVAAGGGGYANHAEIITVPRNLCVRLPAGLDPMWGAFATVGAIALQGIHQADIVPGSRVVVVGLGLVGQLTVRLLDAYGCDVAGVDMDPRMIDLARQAGVAAYSRADERLHALLDEQWDGHGADGVLITAATKSSDPIELAGAVCRDRATVVVVGDVLVAPPRESYYGKELTIRYSRSYGPGRYDPAYEEGGVQYPEGFVPWPQRRNMAEFVRVAATGRLKLEQLDTAVYPIDDASTAYEALEKKGDERRVAILLEYPDRGSTAFGAVDLPALAGAAPAGRRGPSEKVRIAAIGAGSFPTRMLFPHLKGDDVEFTWLGTHSGVSALHQGKSWSFSRAVGDLDEGLALGDTDCVMILSRHDTHGEYAAKVLDAGFGLFCEKPVALTEDELEAVTASWLKAGVPAMVGFNRRFAPAVREIRRAVAERRAQIVYRVFAGKLPSSHWVRDPRHGGRVLGEVCHFVDTAGYVAGSRPVAVTAWSGDGSVDGISTQSVTAVVEYANGTSATILYGGLTPPGAPKEFLEVAADGTAARMDDFKELRIWGGSETRRTFKGGPKGHAEEMAGLVSLMRGRVAPESDFLASLWSSLVTIRLVESLQRGERRAVDVRTPELARALGMPLAAADGGVEVKP